MDKINATAQLRDFWGETKKQLSRHVIGMVGFMFLAIMAQNLITSLIAMVVPSDTFTYQIISLVTNFIVVIFSNTVMFLMIKRVRNERFVMSDVVGSVKMVLYHVVMALFLSIVQLFVQMGCALLAVIPFLYYIVAYVPTAFFLFWNGIVAFAIYDGNRKLSEYITGGFRMLFVNWKMILLLSIPYVITGYVISALATTMYLQVFPDVTNFTDLAGSMQAAGSQMLLIAGMYVIYYLLQAVLQVVLLQIIANLYDRYRTIYMPSLANK